MAPADNTALILRYYEDIWNHGTTALTDEILCPAFCYYPPDAPEGMQSSATHKAYVELYRGILPDLHVMVMAVLADGDKVAVQWTAHGTLQSDCRGRAPAGARVVVRGMDLFHVADDRIAALHSFFDLLTVRRQVRPRPSCMAWHGTCCSRHAERMW